MRKVIVSMNITLDGFMAGPDCELDWHFSYWNEEMAEFATDQLKRADTILLGRVTYKAMSKYWPLVALDPCSPRQDLAFAGMMNSYDKIVFSTTMESADWSNSRLVQDDISKEVQLLKQQPGKDMIIYGSGTIVSLLMRYGLIDEYALWVHPVVLGKGKPFFRKISDKQFLRLVNSTSFKSGVVLLYYESL
jgi:dihydrofolate reductase